MSKTHGKFVWYDVMTSDTKPAESFYRSVIGWDAKDSGMTDRSYTILSMGPKPAGRDVRDDGVQTLIESMKIVNGQAVLACPFGRYPWRVTSTTSVSTATERVSVDQDRPRTA